MSGGTLGCGTALRHVKRVDAVVGMLRGRVHGHSPHIVEGGVERQPRAHPEVHIRAQVVSRRPEVILIVA